MQAVGKFHCGDIKASSAHGSVLFESLCNCAHMHIEPHFDSLTPGPWIMEQPGQ